MRAIPYLDVRELFRGSMVRWLDGFGSSGQAKMLGALLSLDFAVFERELERLVRTAFSFYDLAHETPERVFSAFMLGLLVQLRDRYLVDSNRESGLGRYDLMLQPRDLSNPCFVIEIKRLDAVASQAEQERVITQAVEQIEDRYYTDRLYDLGCKQVVKLVVVFVGKRVTVKLVPAKDVD